ncbi:LVIVD repeat-containing protein [Longimicrobium sp.]|uniref:LVIVD repeat-containing protein n=1 Tax=Longimicrobium sp. TaxID=2029185 RepID=UPI003B3B02A2
MRTETVAGRPRDRWTARAPLAALAAALLATGAQAQDARDPRIGLRAGWDDAGVAVRGMELVSHTNRPAGFFNPAERADFGFANTDMAFSGSRVYIGSYNGFQIYDISDPARPRLRGSLVCPGGQGDVSVHGNLLFLSVEETRGRLDCGAQGVQGAVSAERFRGVRIFDISNLDRPRQVASVQTCRGSHTHTLVPDPRDASRVYIYVQGTSGVRPAEELQGCSARNSTEDPNTSYFRIEVIEVPLARPQAARVVNAPRIFANAQTGAINGLNQGGRQGPNAQETAQTNQCHDITVYPEIGLAAGACAGNGILLDISNPANPVRIDEVVDPNFAYWHSATFNNDGSKVLFTDEWGGGSAPRCRATDRPEWGADAIFTLNNRELRQVGYYKLPAAQTEQENCVAHNGSLIPVPGRDIMVQSWYQGGISIFDFTDPAKPVELAFFDRGPYSTTQPVLGGFWSSYWYNGHIYGTEIGRGLDVFRLVPGPMLTQNEIDAAKTVRWSEFNPQNQRRVTWPASFVVARAYVDQLTRSRGLSGTRSIRVARDLDAAERLTGARRRTALTTLATQLDADAQSSGDAAKVRMLAGVVRDLAAGRR